MDKSIARYIDAAVLYPQLEQVRAQEAIRTAIAFSCRTVCVRPCDIACATDLCRDTGTGVCAVLGFPHGCGLSRAKQCEAMIYADMGVDEIDMVANYGYIRSGAWDLVTADISSVTAVARPRDIVVKVILETSELTQDMIVSATRCAIEAQADYVKTSTGFAGGGATVEAVRTMLDAAGGLIRVKASGGIRSVDQARAYIDMGVSRLGVGYTSLAAICEGVDPPASSSC